MDISRVYCQFWCSDTFNALISDFIICFGIRPNVRHLNTINSRIMTHNGSFCIYWGENKLEGNYSISYTGKSVKCEDENVFKWEHFDSLHANLHFYCPALGKKKGIINNHFLFAKQNLIKYSKAFVASVGVKLMANAQSDSLLPLLGPIFPFIWTELKNQEAICTNIIVAKYTRSSKV